MKMNHRFKLLVFVKINNNSTNIFSPFKVAKHIIDLHIDERLAAGDVTLVNEIARVDMDNGTVKKFYSFATKYCSHHKALDYPIYDSYVVKLLCYFRDIDVVQLRRNKKICKTKESSAYSSMVKNKNSFN